MLPDLHTEEEIWDFFANSLDYQWERVTSPARYGGEHESWLVYRSEVALMPLGSRYQRALACGGDIANAYHYARLRLLEPSEDATLMM